jgi:thiamine pyrophosphate-dependent acetolactate synthase large subunit-like protein
MVAMSMADGYARLTNKPQCVIVHVDVGTQGLGAAVHNASCGRAPVLIFAGLSPYTMEGEYRGSRTEYIHWIQDVPDQKQIVAQYCRYTGEIKRGANVKQMVNRALQFATSDPTGPVYLYGAREAMEEDIEPYQLDQEVWKGVAPAALPKEAVELIADQLVKASDPLCIVGFTGRKASSVGALVTLANKIPGLRVLDTGGSDMCFPANHPASLGMKYVNEESIRTADFILVVDCDVPWIPTQCKPRADAKVIHIDVDPLKQQMPVFYIQAFARFRADSTTAFNQIIEFLAADAKLSTELSCDTHSEMRDRRQKAYDERQAKIQAKAKLPPDHESPINPHLLASQVRAAVPEDTIFAVEAVTLTGFIADQLAIVLPKTWINCGGGGLGWSGGGALGIKLATDFEHRDTSSGDKFGTNKGKFVTQIVGDGTYLFSVPGSVYWIAQRYDIAVLTVVLNNKGWNAPRKSMLLVHPDGEGSRVDNKALNISFDPTPDYAGIAKAASGGRVWAGTVRTVKGLLEELPKAVEAVKGGTSAVLEVQLEPDQQTKIYGTELGKAAT